MNDSQIRYMYAKGGDVIKDLEAIEATQKEWADEGPTSYVSQFLSLVGDAPVLFFSPTSKNIRLKMRNIEAWSFRTRIRGLGRIGRLAARLYMFAASLYKTLCYKPDRVVCGAQDALLWMSYLVAKFYHIPFIHSRQISMELPPTASLVTRLSSALDRWIIRRATAVICIGPYLKEQLKTLGVEEGRLFQFDISHKYAEDLAESIASPLPHDANIRTILFVGRLEVDKGVLDLLNACKRRLKHEDSLRLVYVGGGHTLPELRKRITELNLEDRVVTTGDVLFSQIAGFLKQAWVLVTPTRTIFPEGRCEAAIEGLVIGVPVVAPDFGPFRYIIEDKKNGLLFEPDSVRDLEKKIFAIMDDDVFHRQLAEGAKHSGRQFIGPPVLFAQAVQMAFSRKGEELS